MSSILLLSLFKSSISIVSSSLGKKSSSSSGCILVALLAFLFPLRPLFPLVLVLWVMVLLPVSTPSKFKLVLPSSMSLSRILNYVLRFLISLLYPAISRFFFFLSVSYLGKVRIHGSLGNGLLALEAPKVVFQSSNFLDVDQLDLLVLVFNHD